MENHPATKIMAKKIEEDETSWRKAPHLKSEIQEFSCFFLAW